MNLSKFLLIPMMMIVSIFIWEYDTKCQGHLNVHSITGLIFWIALNANQKMLKNVIPTFKSSPRNSLRKVKKEAKNVLSMQSRKSPSHGNYYKIWNITNNMAFVKSSVYFPSLRPVTHVTKENIFISGPRTFKASAVLGSWSTKKAFFFPRLSQDRAMQNNILLLFPVNPCTFWQKKWI